MFEVTDEPIVVGTLEGRLCDPRAGGIVSFEGRVRNHNGGLRVSSLEYQCYREMALKEGEKIIREALAGFPIFHVHSVHREGHLQIGEIAVWVGVSSSHREEAFGSCQYVIDNIKARVPIWKKEYYIDRKAEWVACHRCQESHVGI